MNDIIEVENKYYVSINSSYADNRTRVLNHMDTFGIFDRLGNIRQIGEGMQGIYYNGMRYISEWELLVNGQRPLLLSSAIKEENELLSADLTNPSIKISSDGIAIPKDLIYIGRSILMHNGACYERMRIVNFGNTAYEVELTLSFDADFKDIFEVRGIKRKKRGEITEVSHLPNNSIKICYRGLDSINRYVEIFFSVYPDEWQGSAKAIYKMKVEPRREYSMEFSLFFRESGDEIEYLNYDKAREITEHELKKNRYVFSSIKTDNEQLNHWLKHSGQDLLSLLAQTPYGKYPYAGVPWYNTAFGRDGLITAMETLWMAPKIARATLLYLAATQAIETDAYRDAEPGKIVHEIREGEMVALNEIPFKQYYGSVDGTLLFVILAGRYYDRTADLDLVKKIWTNIKAAINWMFEYGDSDGDGFIEYCHKSDNGLTNQGWKDSFDSISHANGQLASSPIALCEVQAYAYEAALQGAKLAGIREEDMLAGKLLDYAANLKRDFNERFWDNTLETYVIALDGEKKPCRIVSSNAGHCLFTGIADEDKAAKLITRLMQRDMFSGWGIRTLSKNEKRYNPMSYHNGSVWPHDVALIANGFSKYGYAGEALQLMGAMFDASIFIEQQRLPELFCGFDKRKNEGPTYYPVACSPQAWSVAAVFLLLESCLRLDISATDKKATFSYPVLPVGIREVRIKRLELGNGYAELNINKTKDSYELHVVSRPDDWEITLVTT